MNKNLLVAQSGGPTAAINATLSGILEAAIESSEIGTIYGAAYGIHGLLRENFINLTEKLQELARAEREHAKLHKQYSQTNPQQQPTPQQQSESIIDIKTAATGIQTILSRLSTTPAAALGSCRYKLKDPAVDSSEFESIINIFRKYNIGYFIYIGGNDSMDTVYKLSQYVKDKGIDDITVIGAPKTIDNDLYGIDHCPGFGSAAKYIETSCAELERELEVYDTNYVIIVEMMGRNAGWLTAAAALSSGRNSQVPYLIYLEEAPFDMNRFIADVRAELAAGSDVIVAVSEGIRDRSGKMICDYETRSQATDAFGHTIASGAGKVLSEAVQSNIGCKVRSIELNLLQRCAGHLLSRTDIEESLELGRHAVSMAIAGQTGYMSSLRRIESEEYSVTYEASDLSQIANREKKVPAEWINSEGNGVTEACLEYLKPLVRGELSCEFIDGVPNYVVLK